MACSERAVIYVESSPKPASDKMTSHVSVSGSRVSSTSSAFKGRPGNGHDKNNYIIKIQIGEEQQIFDPVTIGIPHTKHRMVIGGPPRHHGEDSPLNSSGQSSPRSDMTPPPGINAGGAIRFGSETSESDTESDISSEYRPVVACTAARYAMREMLNMDHIQKSGTLPPKTALGKPAVEFQLSSKHMKNTSGMSSAEVSPPSTPSKSPPGTLSKPPPAFNRPFSRDILDQDTSQSRSLLGPHLLKKNNANLEFSRNKILECISDAGQFNKIQLRPSQRNNCARDYASTIVVDEASFHVNEMSEINNGTSNQSSSTTISNFAGYKDIFARAKQRGPAEIMSDKGTIRGVKNRVRDGIVTFLQSTDTKTYTDKEQGRLVVYTTSMGVVRETFQRCQKVKQILRTLMVKFDERDCYMNRSIQNEILQRLPLCISGSAKNRAHGPISEARGGQDPADKKSKPTANSSAAVCLSLPQVFLEGQHLGDAETIERLNETGELRELLRPYKSLSVLSTCDRCGGFRMLPCPICNGSKKSVHRNHFTTEFVALKCMHCDQAGLVRCDTCNTDES